MATDLIRYDVLVQQALRGVVKKVLQDASKEGLPGGHHFYISFSTNGSGVKISPRLKTMYPDEMTIVLQHQFWDLIVSDALFEVSLSFEKVAERLVVPYEAITGFFDPSVKFGLKFEAAEAATDSADDAGKASARGAGKGKTKKAEVGEPTEPTRIGKKPAKVVPALPAPAPAQASPAAETPAEPAAPEAPAEKPGSGEVVSLDAFRKKK